MKSDGSRCVAGTKLIRNVDEAMDFQVSCPVHEIVSIRQTWGWMWPRRSFQNVERKAVTLVKVFKQDNSKY
jgi:hypothetical protein